MAVKRAYLVPLRNDLSGANVHLYDLKPNSSQKANLAGAGQTPYLKYSFDAEADNQVIGSAEGLISGSATTDTISSATNSNVIDPGGNDTVLTNTTEFGLKGYLRERVHVNPGGNGDTLTQTEVNNVYDDIVALVLTSGASLTLAAINAILVARAGANTDLDGAGATSDSFGSVEDIIRMLSGEVYRTRANTMIEGSPGTFLPLADRVTRQANSIFAEPVYPQGGFLVAGEAGYRPMPQLALTEAVRLSARGGVLYGLGPNHPSGGITLRNPNFTYAGGVASAAKPLAVNPFNKTTLPATGLGAAVAVFDQDGNRIE